MQYFVEFTKKELSRIREAKGSGEREVSLTDPQDIADIVEADVMTMITPGGQITFIKEVSNYGIWIHETRSGRTV